MKLHWQVQGTILQESFILAFLPTRKPWTRTSFIFFYCPLCFVKVSQTQNFSLFSTPLWMNIFPFSFSSLFFFSEGFHFLGNSHTVVSGVCVYFKMIHTPELLGWILHPCCPCFVYVKWNCLVYGYGWLFETFEINKILKVFLYQITIFPFLPWVVSASCVIFPYQTDVWMKAIERWEIHLVQHTQQSFIQLPSWKPCVSWLNLTSHM